MKNFLLGALLSMSAPVFAAKVQCQIAQSPELVPYTVEVYLPDTNGAKIEQKIGSLYGVDVYVSAISFGDRYPELKATASVFARVNGVRIDGFDRLLLSSGDQNVIDARCKVQ